VDGAAMVGSSCAMGCVWVVVGRSTVGDAGQ
jgi:hypothetical protein